MRDWWPLINRQAAVRENTPDMRALQHERPGCKADRERREFYRAENQASKRAAEQAQWDSSVAYWAQVREQQEQRRANAAYKEARERRKQAAA